MDSALVYFLDGHMLLYRFCREDLMIYRGFLACGHMIRLHARLILHPLTSVSCGGSFRQTLIVS
jgi:hypothetical protein